MLKSYWRKSGLTILNMKQINKILLEKIFHLTLLMSYICLQIGNDKFMHYERIVFET